MSSIILQGFNSGLIITQGYLEGSGPPPPPPAGWIKPIEYGAQIASGIAASMGLVLLGPWQTSDREQLRIKVHVKADKAFNLNYEFSTDQGATWYVGQQVASASVSLDDTGALSNEAHGHFDVGYWWRISVFNTDATDPMAIAFEWRFHSY